MHRKLAESLRRDIVRASVDLDWLKEEYGVVLPGIAYPVGRTSIWVVDPARREALLGLIERLMNPSGPERSFWATTLARLRTPMRQALDTRVLERS